MEDTDRPDDSKHTAAASERAFIKGMNRRTWTGAPLMDTNKTHAMDVSMVSTMKRKDELPAPDLNRVLGYVGPDVEGDEESDVESDDDDAKEILDRDFIKIRAAKFAARYGNLAQKAP